MLLAAAAVAAAAALLLRPGPPGPGPAPGAPRLRPDVPVDPARAYRLRLWDAALPLPPGEAGQQDVLEAAEGVLRERYPRLEVEITLLPAHEVLPRLLEALRQGDPPDVVGLPPQAHPPGPRLHPDAQVPLSPYLPFLFPRTPPPFHTTALAAWQAEGILWAWPSWLSWRAWLGERAGAARAGLNLDEVAARGWTWTQVVDWTRSAPRGRAPLLLWTHDVRLLADLLLNAPAPAPAGDEGTARHAGFPAPGAEAIRAALDFLEQARVLARPGDGEGLRPTGAEPLQRFVSGDAAVIGPVNAWLLGALLRRSERGPAREELRLLPIPRAPGAPEIAPWEVAGYAVFRQAAYRGDAHTRLAVELALEAADAVGRWLAGRRPVLPAGEETLAAWRAEGPLPPALRAFLLDYLAHAAPAPAPASRPLAWGATGDREALQRAWEDLLAGRLSREAFVERVLSPTDSGEAGRGPVPTPQPPTGGPGPG